MQQFYSVLDAVWALDTDPTTKLVALRLARHWPQIFPGVQDIAAWTKLDERTVRRALKKLQDEGVITVHRRPNTSSVYEFVGVSIPALGAKPPLRLVPGDMPPPPGNTPPGTGSCARSGPGVLPDKQPREQPTGNNQSEGEARELLPHEKSELRKALAPPTGARPVGLHEFREGWKPKDSHRARGKELGLTDAEMLERAEHCKLKFYDHPFPSEDKQFMRELLWLSNDKRGKANPHGRNENPGRQRRPGDPSGGTVFGRIGSR